MPPIIQGIPIELIKQEILNMSENGQKYKSFGQKLKEGFGLL